MSAYRVLPAARVVCMKPVLGAHLTAEAGDTLIPHLYDWSFDGIDDYIVVGEQPDGSGTPFSFQNWSAATAVLNMYPISPAPASTYGYTNRYRGTSPCGIPQETQVGFERPFGLTYDRVYFVFVTNTRDCQLRWLATSLVGVNRWWELAWRWSNATRTIELFSSGSRVWSASVGDDYTVFDVPPALARYVLGASPHLTAWACHLQSYVLIFNRALTDVEIGQLYSGRLVDASGLRLFLDATFYDGSKYVDLSGYGNHGFQYGGVGRVPAAATWLYRVKGLYTGDRVRVLVPPMCRYRVVPGSWQVNDSWSILEIYIDPGRVTLAFEGL